MVRLIGLLKAKQSEIQPNSDTDSALVIKDSSGSDKVVIRADGKWLSDLDLNSNDLLNAIINGGSNTLLSKTGNGSPQGSVSGTSGEFYYDTSNNNLYICKGGTNWQIIGGGSEITSIIAGDGLTGGGSSGVIVIDVGAGDGILVNTDDVAIKLKPICGLEVDSDGLAINDSIAGNGLQISSKVLSVKPDGDSIYVSRDGIKVDTSQNFTWSGTNDFTSTFKLNGTALTASAAEINQALDGISDNVTYTNLNTLTAGNSSDADSLHTHSGLAKQYTSSFSNQTSVTINHNLGRYPLVQVLDNSGYWIIPNSIQHTSTNSFTLTFDEETTGTVIYIG